MAWTPWKIIHLNKSSGKTETAEPGNKNQQNTLQMKRTTNHLVWFASILLMHDGIFISESRVMIQITYSSKTCQWFMHSPPQRQSRKKSLTQQTCLTAEKSGTIHIIYVLYLLKKMHYYDLKNCHSHTSHTLIITSDPTVLWEDIGIGCLRIQHVDVRPLEWRLRILSVSSAGHMVFFVSWGGRGGFVLGGVKHVNKTAMFRLIPKHKHGKN